MAASDVQCCEPMFWVYLVICVVLVCFAGLMSGLTLGLLSISLVDLEVLAKAAIKLNFNTADIVSPILAEKIIPIALPIFVDGLLPAWGAILVSVTLVLAFGEIIPQALCSRYGLSVGAKLSFLVRLLVLILLPISYPISKLLDWLLGERHSPLLGRAELKTFVDMHACKVSVSDIHSACINCKLCAIHEVSRKLIMIRK
uniref:CNNM transmembrane domain-containing protein n=1 Tax=Quercus lobata TaxID=97700 RepID=A0A7N2MJQ8_QUELO